MKKSVLKAIAAICSVAVIGGAAGYGGSRLASSSSADLPQATAELHQMARSEGMTVAATGAIAIPGFDVMKFRAGQTVQSVRLYNPEANACAFVVSIILPSGKEIYQSDLLKPGDSVDEIEISVPLDAAIYTASILRYSCYSLDEDPQELNGADSLFTLEVIP